jgi:putative cardiolipin synthase
VRLAFLLAGLSAIAISMGVSPSLHADVVRILDDPHDALQARVDVIQQASGEIGMLYFLARDDRVTLGVLALLRDAKRRGVRDVRVIVDGNFHRIPKAVLAHLRDEGVEVRVYHPLRMRHPSWILRRMHEKVIVADSARYIAGGRNLGEAYFGLAKKNYVDRDVYVDGASASEADRHFEELWVSPHVAALRVRVSREEKETAGTYLGEVLRDLASAGIIELDTKRDWSADGQDAGTVRFLHDGAGRGHVGGGVAEVLASAQHSIVIESPYFVPPQFLRRLLEKKLAEGVDVRVVTNSFRSTDGALPQAAYLKYRAGLVRRGMEMHEYKGPDVLHAKSIIVDDRYALIGSYNIDPRSQYLNTEIMCVADDEEVASALRASIDAHVANAWTIRRSARGPHVSRAMTLRLWAARLLLPLLEPQL